MPHFPVVNIVGSMAEEICPQRAVEYTHNLLVAANASIASAEDNSAEFQVLAETAKMGRKRKISKVTKSIEDESIASSDDEDIP